MRRKSSNRIVAVLTVGFALVVGCAGAQLPSIGGPTNERQVFANVEPQWSDFGAYLGAMVERVETRWKSAKETKLRPAARTAVTFRLNSKGEIAEVVEAKAPRPASEQACFAVIAAVAPFPGWSEPMRRVLGDTQTVILVFAWD